MARNEVIGSPFFRQLSARSGKLRTYEALFLFNEAADHVIKVLHSMEKLPFVDKESIHRAVVEIEEVRCGVNADCIELQVDNERFDQGRFWKQGREFEKKWRDPDDVYVDVKRREEERKKQGLLPRLGVLPYSATAADDQMREARQERKRKRPSKRRK